MLKQKQSLNFKNGQKNKAVKRILIFFFINTLLLLATPLKSSAINITTGEIKTINPIIDPVYTIDAVPFPESRPIKVAIYNEQNLTAPIYDTSAGDNNNNISNLVDILSANEQIDITIVNVQDIYNRILTTANFDVFAMVDNNPRENITDMVQDFWLAGGGIIAFDGPAVFLSNFGILPPEALGTSGRPAYWDFNTDGFNITNRHPIAKAYSLGTTIAADGGYSYCSWDWTALSGSVIAPDLTPIAHSLVDPNEITVLAFDPTDRGGKVVSIGFDLDHEEIPELDQLIRDAVDWLTPRPKAKIAFDMSHKPRRSIDTWDTYSDYPNSYAIMRDLLVSHGYTVDKLYDVPSGDNFTYDRLSKFDMLICESPDINYTAGDIAAMEAWITDGGSLLAVSDNPTFSFEIGGDQINNLVNSYGMSIVEGTVAGTTFTEFTKHPTTEGVQDIYNNNYGYINITGSAEAIWSEDPLTNIVVACNEHGEGRVVLSTDINWFQDAYIVNADNEQFIINLANWLTAATADVLVYLDWTIGGSYYKNPLALALNDLGIKYYLTSEYDTPAHDYFNMSLNIYEWDMVIINSANQFGLENYYDEIEDYVDSGGMLIMSHFDMDIDDTHPLWAKLGFEYVNTFSDQPPLYIWDIGHPIFNQPFDYNAANFTYGSAAGDDGDMLAVLPNGIPLAGLNTTETAGGAIIVLRDDEQTLFNGYLIDSFNDDIDDSTYLDNFELWKNEIAYMMRPKINYTLGMPSEAFLHDTVEVNVNMTNLGLSDATLGFIDISIPTDLGNTSDSLSDVFTILKGDTRMATWNIATKTLGNYTISFESSYQGYLGTEYSVIFEETITISEAPFNILDLPWWYYAAAGGGLLLIILIIVVATAISKKKKKAATR
ncbi:MAG: DUF4350 domain-containing protein [Candidatus Heimdallarchaeota archaeon]